MPGMEPPLNPTRYDWLAVSALVVSVTGSTAPSPQLASENPTNAASHPAATAKNGQLARRSASNRKSPVPASARPLVGRAK